MDAAEKVRENRARRMAHRRGLTLEKSRRRDPGALDYGLYRLVDARTNVAVLGTDEGFPYTATLEDVETFLADYDARGAR